MNLDPGQTFYSGFFKVDGGNPSSVQTTDPTRNYVDFSCDFVPEETDAGFPDEDAGVFEEEDAGFAQEDAGFGEDAGFVEDDSGVDAGTNPEDGVDGGSPPAGDNERSDYVIIDDNCDCASSPSRGMPAVAWIVPLVLIALRRQRR